MRDSATSVLDRGDLWEGARSHRGLRGYLGGCPRWELGALIS